MHQVRLKLVRHRPRAADPPWMKMADLLHPSAQGNPILSLAVNFGQIRESCTELNVNAADNPVESHG